MLMSNNPLLIASQQALLVWDTAQQTVNVFFY